MAVGHYAASTRPSPSAAWTQAAAHVTPLLNLALADNDHIHRDQQIAKLAPEPHGLLGRILNGRLDDEKVEIATWPTTPLA